MPKQGGKQTNRVEGCSNFDFTLDEGRERLHVFSLVSPLARPMQRDKKTHGLQSTIRDA